ncbi:RHS repeat-associated core domain-containing protein [Spongiactinospora rosea]|uniref:RHS repeat-associated core domain-containing protein n=1 Tax=Spongiactinospora rosea TaxID=2248750 RepID=UPI0013144ABE|nr:RHS repeat-associated core domain-containing protein [Spongiactinospora rosea]
MDGREVPEKKTTKGAEESQPKVKRRAPVWPKAGSAEVGLSGVALAEAGGLPVKVAAVKGSDVTRVKVETLPAETVRKLGGVGIAAQLLRADGKPVAGKVRAEFSYAGFREAYGGQFAGRLQVLRLPTCVLQSPRPRGCITQPTPIKAHNDVKSGTLVADIEVSAVGASLAEVEPPTAKPKDRKAAAAKAAETALAAQLAAGSVYVLAAGMTGPDGNWGATDLKPSGTWQAGTSGGGFDYGVPLPEPPSPTGSGPDLALQYSASSVDGQGKWTNNQAGVVGTGWDLSAGFIERRFRRCDVDNYYDPETADLIWIATEPNGIAGKALCWESPDENDGDSTTNDKSQSELVLNAGGRSAQIVKDRTSGKYKTVPDFGWKIEQVNGGADGQPYWRLTDEQGQDWRFGYTADAQWQVPYVGNEQGEPCFDRYQNDAIPPTCNGVWRWNLDQEIDRNENVTDYSYVEETNYFCLPSCLHETYRVLPYNQGGHLAEATWGHNTQVTGSVPTARMTFDTSSRGGVDEPTDLDCPLPIDCGNSAIAFYSSRKLDSISSEARHPDTGEWDQVRRLVLSHDWIYQRTDFGPPYDPVLWLDTVHEVGIAGEQQITVPPHDFDAVMLAGKMDYDTMSDWTDLLSWRMVPRIGAISNGMGGRIEVTYGQADPCGGGKGRDGSDYLPDKTGDCYQVDYGSDPDSGYESWARFYKQLAVKVVERDMVAGSPDMVYNYEFIGSPWWTNRVQFAQPNQAPTGSDWRGYGQVRTIEGSGTDPSGYSVSTRTFLRGTGQAVPHFEGGTVTDVAALQGEVLQEQEWKMTSLSPRAYTEVDSTRYEYTIQSTGNGPGTMDPAFVLTTRERSREKVTGGGWRYTDKRTAYNADGLPNKVNEYGQDGVTADNTCTSTTYARNGDPGQWLLDFPSVTEVRAGDDCASGTLIGKKVTLYDQGTDPATNKPTDGNATEVRSYATASTISTVKATFDDYGRPLTGTDALGKVATTTYSPAVGWPSDGVTVTNPLGHTLTTQTSFRYGSPTKITDANGKVAEFDYDALGRTTTVWGPGQPRGGGTPTGTVSYHIAWDGWGQPTAATKTTTKRLLTGSGPSAKWLTSHSYDDGFGRAREAQSDSPAGGRIVTVTAYDARGLTLADSDPVHNQEEAGSGLLNPALTSLPQWTKNVYDDQERVVAAIDYNLGTELRRTTTAYPGEDRTEVTPPVGGKTATVTDAFGRTVKVEEWADGSAHNDTTYAYDLNNNPVKMTDANGNVRSSTFDWLGRRLTAADPDAGASSYGYDAAGRLLWSLNAKNQKISNTYDDLGRQTAQWAGEPNTGTKLAEWTFDTVALGQPGASTSYADGRAYSQAVTAYDHSYRPTATKLTIPAAEGALGGEYAFTNTYDAAGNMRQQTLPAGGGLPAETLTHAYTDLGLVNGLTSGLGTYLKDVAYSPTAKLDARALGANGQIKRTLHRDPTTDRLSRLVTQTKADTTAPETVQDDRYSYDIGGQITRVLDAASAVPGTTDGQSECFAYDGLLRLKTAYTTTAPSCTGTGDGNGSDPYRQAFTYDKVGNITSLTDGGQNATYAYPAPGASAVRPNAVTSITRPGSTDTYTYDAVGQLTGRNVAGKAGTFTWDPLGRLTEATVEGEQTGMVYDASGERLIRREPDGSAILYAGPMELRLSGGQVTGKRYYASADGALIAMRDASGVRWLLSGSHGSTQLSVHDGTGQVSRERYLPFGQRRGEDDLPFTDRGFLGKVEDAGTGLSYLSARYYDSSIGKFISPDPEVDPRKPEWANPYSYAGNNPIGMSDPTGLRVDTGNRGSDRTFYKTHKPSGQKKTKWEHKLEKKHQRATEAQERKIKKARQAEIDRRTRDRSITKQDPTQWETDVLLEEEWHRNFLARLLAVAKQQAMARGDADIQVYLLGAGWSDKLSLGPRGISLKIPLGAKRPYPGFKIFNPKCNSFIPGTKVLMADGTHKPIEDVKVGDKVIATDLETGQTTVKPVAALHTSKGAKEIVQITVGRGEKIAVAYATDEHPFWLPELRQWREAEDLRPGQWLLASTGTYVQIADINLRPRMGQRVHNLTVDSSRTYYVLLGSHSVLVHNTDECPPALKMLHPVESLNKSSLDYWSKKTNDEIIKSLKLGSKEGALLVKPDGTIMNGNTRIHVLKGRGIDVSRLPRTIYKSEQPKDGFWD